APAPEVPLGRGLGRGVQLRLRAEAGGLRALEVLEAHPGAARLPAVRRQAVGEGPAAAGQDRLAPVLPALRVPHVAAADEAARGVDPLDLPALVAEAAEHQPVLEGVGRPDPRLVRL